MVKVILDPYSSFRTEGFTAIVTEMGIKEFGEDAIPKAYIEFDDGGAPITYPLDVKGKSMIEDPTENGHAKVRNFGLGAFAEQARKLGYETFIDTDHDSYEFGTIPDATGLSTTWEAKKGGKRIDADGTEREGYTNFTLIAIGDKKVSEQSPQTKKAPMAKPPAKTQQAIATTAEDLTESWKEVLVEIGILDKPLNEAGILRAVNAKYPDDDKRKAIHKSRKAALQELVKAKFLTVNENGQYEERK